ncbi:MBL fold metallo-hydrolase [Lysobacter niastensis]|uniref:MBL fold metallo-hydrolase n=2 Tax=Lysobacter niastensis TaxID=380629 RepID=A0ABS0B732_9GAMM|nr:MBL fold metallo-hydrolase [Lysobacter niastensis]
MTAVPDSTRFHLQFLGACGTVTGSRYLVEAAGHRLLVDCGLFQGYKTLRLRNWASFPVDPASLDAVVLTHAHLDHSGYLPRLELQGFHKRVWCTHATASLCRILLPDSGHLLEEEATYAHRVGSSRHSPARPLYTEDDARRSLELMRMVEFEQDFEPVPGMTARFRMQGHILGAAAVTLEFAGTRITFSGDLGRPNDPVMPPPRPLGQTDWIVTEATYGNRLHPAISLEQELHHVLAPVLARGGIAIIPSFAVGRAQMLLHVIAKLQADHRLPDVPVYLNSPMATDVSDLYARHSGLHRLESQDLDAMRRMTIVINSAEESKALNRHRGPMIIVSASGMLTGGRVLHHLIAFSADPRNAIVLCGYQAGGTRGAALVGGARSLRIYGQDVAINAQVIQLTTASAHADANEILAWLHTAEHLPRGVFITHGEPDAADALRVRIKRELGWPAHVPEYLEKVTLQAQRTHDVVA